MKNPPESITDEFNNLVRQAELMAAIEAAYKPEVRKALLAYANSRCKMLAVRGDRGARGEAEDLVQDAIVDTWLGRVAWDRSFPFDKHIISVVRGRTARRLERHVARPHTSINDTMDGEFIADELGARGVDPGPEVGVGLEEVTQEALRFVRELAAGDAGINELVDHYERGAIERYEVIEQGMDPAAHDNARRRLDRLLASAPDELRIAAHDCWRAA